MMKIKEGYKPIKKKIKCELYNDSMQGWKCYPIQKAQLIIADIPYNVGNKIMDKFKEVENIENQA